MKFVHLGYEYHRPSCTKINPDFNLLTLSPHVKFHITAFLALASFAFASGQRKTTVTVKAGDNIMDVLPTAQVFYYMAKKQAGKKCSNGSGDHNPTTQLFIPLLIAGGIFVKFFPKQKSV